MQIYLSNKDKSFFINLGMIINEKSIPIAKGKSTGKLRSATDPIINGQIPIASKKALPDMPGIKRKEKAINPQITRGKVLMDTLKSDKSPIKIPRPIAIRKSKENKIRSFL